MARVADQAIYDLRNVQRVYRAQVRLYACWELQAAGYRVNSEDSVRSYYYALDAAGLSWVSQD
jgi:hypothetical protein